MMMKAKEGLRISYNTCLNIVKNGRKGDIYYHIVFFIYFFLQFFVPHPKCLPHSPKLDIEYCKGTQAHRLNEAIKLIQTSQAEHRQFHGERGWMRVPMSRSLPATDRSCLCGCKSASVARIQTLDKMCFASFLSHICGDII